MEGIAHHSDEMNIDASLRKLGGDKIRLEFSLENAPPEYNRILTVDEYDVNRETGNNSENVDPSHIQIHREKAEICNSHQFGNSSTWFFEIKAKPGRSYKFTIVVNEITGNDVENEVKWSGCIGQEPTAYQFLPREKLTKLKAKAEKFCDEQSGGEWEQADYLSHCKFKGAWDAIDANGGNLMETRIRTKANGHATALNYSYGGIFFFLRPTKITHSPFGDKMREAKAHLIFGHKSSEQLAFYFADIKCYNNSMPHYICLAVCRRRTEQEKFCDRSLVRLKFNSKNRFLRLKKDATGGCKFLVPGGHIPNKVWIEIFFMENVQIDWKDMMKNGPRNEVRIRDVILMHRRDVNSSERYRTLRTCNICGSDNLRDDNGERGAPTTSSPRGRQKRKSATDDKETAENLLEDQLNRHLSKLRISNYCACCSFAFTKDKPGKLSTVIVDPNDLLDSNSTSSDEIAEH